MKYIGKNAKLEKDKPSRRIRLTDFFLCIKARVGDEREEDVLCDSQDMLGLMDRLGASMQKKCTGSLHSKKCMLLWIM